VDANRGVRWYGVLIVASHEIVRKNTHALRSYRRLVVGPAERESPRMPLARVHVFRGHRDFRGL